MGQFHYVYILSCLNDPDRYYIGLTDDLHSRLHKHNNGEVPHTSKYKPWKIKTAIAFTDRERAIAFERYLKSGSGRAFAKKHPSPEQREEEGCRVEASGEGRLHRCEIALRHATPLHLALYRLIRDSQGTACGIDDHPNTTPGQRHCR